MQAQLHILYLIAPDNNSKLRSKADVDADHTGPWAGRTPNDDEQDHFGRDSGNFSIKIRAAHPLTPFLAVRKLRAGKVSRQSRTARYFWQRSQGSTSSTTPQTTSNLYPGR